MYEETEAVVRIKEELTDKFRTTKRIRQGCDKSML